MILNDLLGLEVRDDAGVTLGRITDARFVLDGPVAGEGSLAQARLFGFLVSPHGRSSYLGYERSGVNSPWLIARFMAWRHRGTFLVDWADVESIDSVVRLRPGYTRADPALT